MDYREARRASSALPTMSIGANAICFSASGYSISFRAVATFMLDAVERRMYVREIVGVAS